MEFNITPELVIGIFLIAWGASIIIKLIWGIDIPIFKPLLAIFLIILGFSMLFGTHTRFFCYRSSYTYTADEYEKK